MLFKSQQILFNVLVSDDWQKRWWYLFGLCQRCRKEDKLFLKLFMLGIQLCLQQKNDHKGYAYVHFFMFCRLLRQIVLVVHRDVLQVWFKWGISFTEWSDFRWDPHWKWSSGVFWVPETLL